MRKVLLTATAGTFVGILCCIFTSSSVHASGSWMDGEFTFGQEVKSARESDLCAYRTVSIGGKIPATIANVCVYERPSWRYGYYTEVSGPPYAPRYNTFLVVGVGDDKGMYKVLNPGGGAGQVINTPGSNDLMYNILTMGFTNNRNLILARNFPSRLYRSFNGTETTYEVKAGSFAPLLVDADNTTVTTGATGGSKNGRWIATELRNVGLMLMNMESGQLQMFSDYKHRYGVGSDAHITFIISDDGRYVATFDYNITPSVYKLSDDCGLIANSYSELSTKLADFHPCPTDGGRLQMALDERFGSVVARTQQATRFSYGNDILYFQRTEYQLDDTQISYDMPLYSGNFQSSSVEYLALGDSYSSGEGDTARDKHGNKYYRDKTNIAKTDSAPEEKCHISTRSYPYLLAKDMALGDPGNVDQTKWQTVACAGAEARNDYVQSKNYLGQGGRLKDLAQKLELYRESALQSYIPGRIQQLEFVSRDQPKVLTLTAGGNDVGFGDILKKCTEGGTCDYAEGYAQTAALAHTILAEKDKLKKLYLEIHKLSPQTKIYVIGYPQFISSKNNCGLNVQLDEKERRFVRQGVTYMNNVIEAAAKEVGVRYVDVEDAIDSHALCGEGEIGVSGINKGCVPWLAWTSGDDCQESFHPNHLGHQAIASQIFVDIGDISSYQHCDNGEVLCPASDSVSIDTPSLFKEALDREAEANTITPEYRNATLASTGYARKNPIAVLDIQYSGLQPNTDVSMSMASEPIDLGNYRVDENGELSVSVALPANTPAGRHTLYIDAKTFSGEPIRLWQIVTIYGGDGDLDEDGVHDEEDSCLYVSSSGIDSDADGIDDACDLFVGAKVSNARPVAGGLVSFIASNGQMVKEDQTYATEAEPGPYGAQLPTNPSFGDSHDTREYNESSNKNQREQNTPFLVFVIPVFVVVAVSVFVVYTRRKL